MIQTTAEQTASVRKKLTPPINWSDEKLWNYLVADILDRAADQTPYLALLCGEPVPATQRLDVWFEAQPLSPRKGKRGEENETNSRIDLSFGAIRLREKTGCGIGFDKAAPHSWACFVEGKGPERDCDFMSEHDLLRNQLTRDIESLLCFQAHGTFPDRLYFTLLTPRLFQQHWRSRLYGYRMREYLDDPVRIIPDIQSCTLPRRDDGDQEYPLLPERLRRLKLTWVTYEDILERHFGRAPLDTLLPDQIPGLTGLCEEVAARLAAGPVGPAL